MNIIDPHLHLFNLAEGDYHWLKPDSPPFWPDKQRINRSFLEPDLKLEPPLTLAGFVHIEAGFDNAAPWRELDWLERHCRRPFRSIAFADLTRAEFADDLARLRRYRSLVGIRHILDDRAAELLGLKSVSASLGVLSAEHLLFEAQLPGADERGVEQLCRVLERLPELRVCIGHGAFPPLSHEIEPGWKASLDRLAQFPHCAIKCSGWEMAARCWQPLWAERVLGCVIDSFGLSRVMLASNFPLCELGTGYGAIWRWYGSLPGFSETERQALCFENARRWYGF